MDNMETIIVKLMVERPNIFTFNKLVTKNVTKVIETSEERDLDFNLDLISRALYRKGFDIYEESKRDRNVWNRYFQSIVNTCKSTVVEIDNNNEKEVPVEVDEIC